MLLQEIRGEVHSLNLQANDEPWLEISCILLELISGRANYPHMAMQGRAAAKFGFSCSMQLPKRGSELCTGLAQCLAEKRRCWS